MSHFHKFLVIVTVFLVGAVPTAAQLAPDLRLEVEADMEEIRGLALLEPIQVSTISQEEFRAQTIADLDVDYPADERERDTRVLVAFGLLSPDADLGELYAELLGGSVAGYYDPFSGEMVIVSLGAGGEAGAIDQVTYAHETVHAIQDQHFDLAALLDAEVDMSTDESLALRSLVEGDATVAELDYLLGNMDLARDYLSEAQAMDLEMPDDLPEFLIGTLTFPYNHGYEFVQFLYDEGGWDLVNSAYDDLPVSSEQVLHPEKYLDGELPVVVTVDDHSSALGPDWVEIDRDTLGEYVISILLEDSELSREQVERAANGWGGDAYAVFATEDQLAIDWQTSWDSEKDATEFARALAIREANRLGGDAVEENGVTTIDADGVIVQITQDGQDVTYLQAPTQEILDTLDDADLASVDCVPVTLAGIRRHVEDAA